MLDVRNAPSVKRYFSLASGSVPAYLVIAMVVFAVTMVWGTWVLVAENGRRGVTGEPDWLLVFFVFAAFCLAVFVGLLLAYLLRIRRVGRLVAHMDVTQAPTSTVQILSAQEAVRSGLRAFSVGNSNTVSWFGEVQGVVTSGSAAPLLPGTGWVIENHSRFMPDDAFRLGETTMECRVIVATPKRAFLLVRSDKTDWCIALAYPQAAAKVEA